MLTLRQKNSRDFDGTRSCFQMNFGMDKISLMQNASKFFLLISLEVRRHLLDNALIFGPTAAVTSKSGDGRRRLSFKGSYLENGEERKNDISNERGRELSSR